MSPSNRGRDQIRKALQGEMAKPLTRDEKESARMVTPKVNTTDSRTAPADVPDPWNQKHAAKPTHAPGPWTWWKAEINGNRDCVDGRYVATLDDANRGASIVYHDAQWPITEANARLIAAAPDLLAALKELTEIVGDHGYGLPFDRAKRAIRRAEGQ
jgi:hypothetical protein